MSAVKFIAASRKRFLETNLAICWKAGMVEVTSVICYNKIMDFRKNQTGQSAGKTLNKISKEMGFYLSGFADGEGSFNISLINRSDYKNKWKVVVAFNISQKDNTVPLLFKKILKCGTIRYRKDGVCYYEVTSIKDIKNIIIPFFKKFPILSEEKRLKFGYFLEISKIVYYKKHLNKEGMKKLLSLRDLIKVKRKRKYSNREILKNY